MIQYGQEELSDQLDTTKKLYKPKTYNINSEREENDPETVEWLLQGCDLKKLPKTFKMPEDKRFCGYSSEFPEVISVSETIGGRKDQEDACYITLDERLSLLKDEQIKELLKKIIEDLANDEEIKQEGELVGACALLTIVIPQKQKAFVAYLGDSVTFAIQYDKHFHVKNFETINKDLHTPLAEKKRIKEERGIEITTDRLTTFPNLSVSRAIGDSFSEKGGLIHIPNIVEYDFPKNEEGITVIVSGCDGIYEQNNKRPELNHGQLELIGEALERGEPLHKIARDLILEAVGAIKHEKGKKISSDNGTANIIVGQGDFSTLSSIYDGHGGAKVAQLCAKKTSFYLERNLKAIRPDLADYPKDEKYQAYLRMRDLIGIINAQPLRRVITFIRKQNLDKKKLADQKNAEAFMDEISKIAFGISCFQLKEEQKKQLLLSLAFQNDKEILRPIMYAFTTLYGIKEVKQLLLSPYNQQIQMPLWLIPVAKKHPFKTKTTINSAIAMLKHIDQHANEIHKKSTVSEIYERWQEKNEKDLQPEILTFFSLIQKLEGLYHQLIKTFDFQSQIYANMDKAAKNKKSLRQSVSEKGFFTAVKEVAVESAAKLLGANNTDKFVLRARDWFYACLTSIFLMDFKELTVQRIQQYTEFLQSYVFKEMLIQFEADAKCDHSYKVQDRKKAEEILNELIEEVSLYRSANANLWKKMENPEEHKLSKSTNYLLSKETSINRNASLSFDEASKDLDNNNTSFFQTRRRSVAFFGEHGAPSSANGLPIFKPDENSHYTTFPRPNGSSSKEE